MITICCYARVHAGVNEIKIHTMTSSELDYCFHVAPLLAENVGGATHKSNLSTLHTSGN